MKQKLNQLALFATIALFVPGLKAQNLAPAELLKIHANDDISTVTAHLADKGFEFGQTWQDIISKEITSNWGFKPVSRPGEKLSTFLQKSRDSSGKETTKLTLFNPYQYKEFISALIKDKYEFRDIRIIKNHAHNIFRSRNKTFMTAELRTPGNESYFEIILTTN